MEKENSIEKQIFYSEWVRIAHENGITFHKIIDALKEKFDVKFIKIDGEKIIWLEKKNGQKKEK